MTLDMAVQTCNPSIQKVEAGGLPQVHASQSYIVRSCFKEQKNQTKPKQNQQKCSDRILTGITLAGQFGEN